MIARYLCSSLANIILRIFDHTAFCLLLPSFLPFELRLALFSNALHILKYIHVLHSNHAIYLFSLARWCLSPRLSGPLIAALWLYILITWHHFFGFWCICPLLRQVSSHRGHLRGLFCFSGRICVLPSFMPSHDHHLTRTVQKAYCRTPLRVLTMGPRYKNDLSEGFKLPREISMRWSAIMAHTVIPYSSMERALHLLVFVFFLARCVSSSVLARGLGVSSSQYDIYCPCYHLALNGVAALHTEKFPLCAIGVTGSSLARCAVLECRRPKLRSGSLS